MYAFTRAFLAVVLLSGPVMAQKKAKAPEPPPPVAWKGGHLVYTPDEKGDRIPDFSYSGYKGGDSVIPNVTVRVIVPFRTGDATFRIQQALDYVGSLRVDASGFRGAVLLEKGVYEVSGSLKINASGVVLRGSGMGQNGTTLLATGTDRRTLIRVAGVNDRIVEKEVDVTDGYVPVNAMHLRVGGGFHVGDHILVHRPSTAEWIKLLGMEAFGGGISALGWKPGQRDIYWDRRVMAVDGDGITIDAPLTTALDTAYGGGKVAVYHWGRRIENVGIENLRCRSAYDIHNPKDEAHSWMAITMENLSDAWVRQVIVEHFAGSAVDVLETANRVTVEDCKYLSPVSEIGGQRRNAFITMGGQTLFQRLYSERAFHDFSVGYCAPGPNAFVQCQSYYPYNISGAIDSWASGILFDVVNVDAQVLSYSNREQDGQGAGWCAANSLFWNCTAARINCYRPPGAQNWSYGSWAQFGGDGYWNESNATIQPRSFYYAQLGERLGGEVAKRAAILPIESEASSSPTVEQAAALIAASKKPRVQMTEWIDQAAQRNPIPVDGGKEAIPLSKVPVYLPPVVIGADPMKLINGWLVRGGTVLVGRRHYEPWWMGTVRPYGVAEAKPAITRWVPGRTGTGLTDDLFALADSMRAQHVVAMDHNYGLWYERRRDDHERIRRLDGDVWPPFYELPFKRSGKDTAWDGLSKYDLTKYNPYYWSRLRTFADFADIKGLVLIHQNYFQHNIIEAGAHYADFPWRPANNINNTGFPEPPPFAGDKRIFMAEQFYDTTHVVRKALHRAFIRQCLDNFSTNTGVIQLIGAEFTGPLHFVQFWLSTIEQWEKEKGHRETIGLSTTKDVQDAILVDAERSAVVDVIDIRYWYYQEDGKVYAPLGGQSLAPRQHERILKPKRPSFESVYRAVKEYRLHYPGKAVLYSAEGCDNFGWAVFMGGGSLANVPVSEVGFLRAAATMHPLELSGLHALGNKDNEYIIYAVGAETVRVGWSGKYKVVRVDAQTGKVEKAETVEGEEVPGKAVLWITK